MLKPLEKCNGWMDENPRKPRLSHCKLIGLVVYLTLTQVKPSQQLSQMIQKNKNLPLVYD